MKWVKVTHLLKMESEKFDVDQIKTYWLTEAEEALRVADHRWKRQIIPMRYSLVTWR
jgi:chorismate-pyruvate lyase